MKKEEIEQEEQRIRVADAGEEYRKQFDNLPAIRFNAFCAGANWALQSENERLKAGIAKLPKLDKGDKIKLYGKETEVIGFEVAWNEGLFDYEIILLTEGRGDPFKRSLGSIEILPQPPKQ